MPRTGTLGMAVFLASLTMLFGACIVGYVVIRLRAESWPPPGAPDLPATLWLSTLLAMACSLAAQRALNRIRAGKVALLRGWLLVALGLAVLFLASQGLSWLQVVGEATFRTHLYGFGFVMLTGLHGAHVAGGVIGLIVVWILALRGSYSAERHDGVRNTAIYWHYLTVVWLVLFGVLLAGG